MIINSGIQEVVYATPFPMEDVSLSLFREAGVKIRRAADTG
jgi:deoxycytidylate deaminase